MRTFSMAIALGVSLVCGACQTRDATPLQTVSTPPLDQSYNLGTGDRLRVTTFGEANLSGEFAINELGHVSLPLIGEIQAGGLTLDQFRSEVTAALSSGYLKNPRVSVEVVNYRPFYVLGEVVKPAQYPFSTGLTVLNAIATAGGFTYRANTKRVFIRGQSEPREHAVPLNGTTPVHPGDTLRIAERLF